MSNELRIAVSGKSGCGNTTVSRLLSQRLGIRLINYTFHDLAREKGLAFETLCVLAEKDPQYDLLLDRKHVELASEQSCVLGSRLAIWLLEKASLKVYLTAPALTRAERIARREGIACKEALSGMNRRDARDRRRYIRLYSINIDRYEFADLTVNTVLGDQFYVVDQIMKALRERSLA